MRIAEYKQVSNRTETQIIHHGAECDEDGNITAEEWDETIEVQVPIMGMAYRDATPEEIEEIERNKEEMQEQEPTTEERLGALETTTDDMILLMADLIGGN